MRDEQSVFVVDDDPDIRSSLKALFDAVRMPAYLFESAEQFLLSDHLQSPGCLLLDVRMPGMGGMQLLTHLQAFRNHPPVIMLTGYGDIPMVLQAMKSGALDFIEKPANHQKLLDSVHKALAIDRERRAEELDKRQFHATIGALSLREVLRRMVDGASNKSIAAELGISERTLEKHRGHIMHKLDIHALAELIRAAVQHGLG